MKRTTYYELTVYQAPPQYFTHVNSFNHHRLYKVGTIISPILHVRKLRKRVHSNCYINDRYYNYAFYLLEKVTTEDYLSASPTRLSFPGLDLCAQHVPGSKEVCE